MSKNLKAWLGLLFLAAIWGTSFILIKKSLVYYSGLEVASIRIASAFLVFLPYTLAKFKDFPKDKLKYMLLSGLLGVFFPAYCFTFAGGKIDSAISGALNSLTPIFTIIIGMLFFAQKVRKLQFIGIGLCFFGSMFLVFTKNKGTAMQFNVYSLLVFAATIMYGFNLHITKKYLNNVPSFIITAGLLSCVGIPALAILFSGNFVQKTIAAPSFMPLFYAIFLGVFSTGLATVLFNKVLTATNVVFASSVTYLIPIFAFLWGFFDQEAIQLGQYFGLAVILIGVYFVNKQ